jgi:raffinose/stachyose/melibiose transport system substrate-binding protein
MTFKSSRSTTNRSPGFGALALAVSAALVLVGCSAGSSSGKGGSATAGSITWWGWTPEIAVGQKYIAAFNKAYPDIKVNYKQVAVANYDAAIRPALASSVGPDVFNVAPGGGIGSVGAYENSAIDLAPAIEKALGSDWKTKVAPIGPAGLSTPSGKLAALSVGSTFAGSMWVNPNLFAQYNLTPPTTLDEWVKVCAAFKSHNVTCYEQGVGDPGFNQDMVHAIADSIQPGLWSKASTGDAKWTDPVFVKTWTIFQSMFSNGIMQQGALGVQQYPDVNNDFLSGKTAMVMMGTWYMQYSTVAGATAAVSAAGVADAKPFATVSVPFPDVAGAGNPAPLFGDADYGLAVNTKSKSQAAAETFVTWLATNSDGQQIVANALNDISSLANVSPSWSDIALVDPSKQKLSLEALIKQASTVTEPRLALVDKALGQALGIVSSTVAEGTATPEKALATLQATVGK